MPGVGDAVTFTSWTPGSDSSDPGRRLHPTRLSVRISATRPAAPIARRARPAALGGVR